VVSYFLRYFSSTSPNKFLQIPPDLSPVSILLLCYFRYCERGARAVYGQDPILPSSLRFGTMAAIGLAARSVAVAVLWGQATDEGQNISVDVRKALRRFCGSGRFWCTQSASSENSKANRIETGEKVRRNLEKFVRCRRKIAKKTAKNKRTGGTLPKVIPEGRRPPTTPPPPHLLG
jgi:hypothetical protein